MRAPVIFAGHGSPMNAIEDNKFSQNWSKIGRLYKPSAILCISAHWYTRGSYIESRENPEMIYDMYGFPEELYKVRYPAPGSVKIASRIKELLGDSAVLTDEWGLDHGTWSVLKWMYPDAYIPVLQLSVNGLEKGQYHYDIGKKLSVLRDEGVLILGSGNVVHNLGAVKWDMEGGFDWAQEFDKKIKEAILNGDTDKVLDPSVFGEIQRKSFRSPDHYYPLLYVLGASDEKDRITVFNEECVLGSLSMTGYIFNDDENVVEL